MKHTQMVTLIVDKKEMKLIDEACLYGAGAAKNLKKAVPEAGKYRLSFSHDELDDLAGFVAACANHEESERKQERWDRLYKKIEAALESSDDGAAASKIIPLPLPPAKQYVFDVSLLEGRCEPPKGDVGRRIRIDGGCSLYEFAETITEAFNFYFDHCFGFYDNFQKYHDSKKMYELFVDIGEDPVPQAKSVERTRIKQVFKRTGDRMMFLFDYGDCWRFAVELKETRHADKDGQKTKILKKNRQSPAPVSAVP